MNYEKYLSKIIINQKNVHFEDFTSLLRAFGFVNVRSKGSHFIYKLDNIRELINIQNVRGEVKPYQVRQFMGVVEKYNLKLQKENE